MGQLWVTDSLGGYLGNKKLSRTIRVATQPLMKFRQFCNIKEALGKQKNDLIFFDKISNVASQGGTLIETNTMPETEITIQTGTLLVTEYGNSIPFTGKLATLAEFDIDNIVTVALRNDEAKVLDSSVAGQFVLSQLKYACLTASSAGSFQTLTADATQGTTTSGANFDMFHLKECVDKLKTLNIAKYDGENYMCIGSVNAFRGVKNHSDWTDAAKYGDPDRLFSGEIGRIEGVRCVEETNFLSNARGGSTFGEAVMFGADAVMESVALPEEIRAKIPGDYGRSRGIAWYSILGFTKIWDYTGDSECHIIHINSV